MKDEDKSKSRLIKELEGLRRRVVELEESKTVIKQAGEASSDGGAISAFHVIAGNEWELMFNHFPDFIMILDNQHRIVAINKAMADGLGVSPKDAMGKRCYELVHGRDKPPEFCPHAKLLRDGREHREEIYEKNIGGFYIVSTSPLHDTRGCLIGSLHISRDINARKRAEDALRKSEEKYRLVVENTNEAIVIAQDGMRKFFNRKALELTGYTKEEFGSQPFVEFIHPDDRHKVIERHRKRLNGEDPVNIYSFRIIDKAGNEKWMEINAIRIEWEGRPASLNFMTDITKRKHAEDALRESEKKYHSIFENIQDVYYEITLDGKILEVSPSIEKISRYKREELIGKSLYDIYAEPKKRDELIKKILKNGRVTDYEVLLKDKDGAKNYCSTSAKLACDKQGNPVKIICSLHNITERKRIEESFRESEKTLKAILEASPVGIGLIRNRILDWANKAMYRMLGYEEGSLLGESTGVLYPDDKEYDRIDRELYTGIDATGIGNVETRWIKKDGSVIRCFLQARALVSSGPEKVLILAAMDITDQKKAEEYIHILTHELIRAQEDERTMISRELHDRVAQDLSVSKIECDTVLKNQPALPPEVKQKLTGISNGLQGAISAIRDLSYELRPPGLDQMGLADTILQYCEEFSEKTGLNVDFTSAGMDSLKFNFNTKINLYRLVQEGLNNTRKHADASRVTIRLAAAHPNIILRINDDGKGFDVKERLANALNEKRMGLRSMEERANLLQGNIEIQSQPMQGTKISIKIPYSTQS